MAKKMFVEGGKEGEWKPSIVRGALRPLSDMQFNRWAKTRAKVELQADPEVVARREEVLAALREKYDAEDKLNPGPLTPAETAARAREWVNARAANNPLPYPEPAGIDFCFDTPTRGGADASDRLYKVGKGNIVEKLLSERAFRDTSEGVELISESRVSINAAMQIAHQRFGGKPIAFQGGWDQSRDVIAAKSIILGIPVKGPDMERRVSQLRAKIDKEKEAILAKEGHQPVRQTPEPERQREPEVELTPEQTPEIQPERAPEPATQARVVDMAEPVVYDASRYMNRGEEIEDETFPAVSTTFTIENENGRAKLDYDSGNTPGREFTFEGNMSPESIRQATELARQAGIKGLGDSDRAKIESVLKMHDQMKGQTPEIQPERVEAPALKIAIVDMSRPEIISQPVPSTKAMFVLDGEAGKVNLHFDGAANDGRGEYTFDGGEKAHPQIGNAEDVAKHLGLPDPADHGRLGKIEEMWKQHDKVNGVRTVAEPPAHEDHLRAIAGQLEGGTPTADPNIPGHVGYNAQGDNVCAMSDQNGQIRAWGVYGDDGKPLSTKGEDGWKEALSNVVSEPLKERAIARETPTPEKESPSQEKSADDRDM